MPLGRRPEFPSAPFTAKVPIGMEGETMEPLQLQPEVFVVALALYAAIVIAVTLANAREARSGGLDEAGPGAHVPHESRAQALARQIFGAHR